MFLHNAFYFCKGIFRSSWGHRDWKGAFIRQAQALGVTGTTLDNSFPVLTVLRSKSSFSFPASLNVELLSFLRDQEKLFIPLYVKAAAFSNILLAKHRERERVCFTLSSLFKIHISSPRRKTKDDANYRIIE